MLISEVSWVFSWVESAYRMNRCWRQESIPQNCQKKSVFFAKSVPRPSSVNLRQNLRLFLYWDSCFAVSVFMFQVAVKVFLCSGTSGNLGCLQKHRKAWFTEALNTCKRAQAAHIWVTSLSQNVPALSLQGFRMDEQRCPLPPPLKVSPKFAPVFTAQGRTLIVIEGYKLSLSAVGPTFTMLTDWLRNSTGTRPAKS